MIRTKTKTGTCYCAAGIDGEGRKMTPPDLNGQVVDPRLAALVKVSGHFGPWCNREFREAGVHQPVPRERDRPEPPEEVVQARQVDAELREQFDAADEAWREALARVEELKRERRENTRYTGRTLHEMVYPEGNTEKIRAAEDTAERLQRDREDAARAYKRAHVHLQKVEGRWRDELRHAEYETTAQK